MHLNSKSGVVDWLASKWPSYTVEKYGSWNFGRVLLELLNNSTSPTCHSYD